MDTERVQVGDVIQCKKFAIGQYATKDSEAKGLVLDKRRILVGRAGNEIHAERVEKGSGGWERKTPYSVDTDAPDPSRGKAKFVVTDAKMAGGSPPGAHDPYPDGWQVIASRFNSKGDYDPRAEVIEFYQGGCFVNTIKDPIDVVGRMKVTVTVTRTIGK